MAKAKPQVSACLPMVFANCVQLRVTSGRLLAQEGLKVGQGMLFNVQPFYRYKPARIAGHFVHLAALGMCSCVRVFLSVCCSAWASFLARVELSKIFLGLDFLHPTGRS